MPPVPTPTEDSSALATTATLVNPPVPMLMNVLTSNYTDATTMPLAVTLSALTNVPATPDTVVTVSIARTLMNVREKTTVEKTLIVLTVTDPTHVHAVLVTKEMLTPDAPTSTSASLVPTTVTTTLPVPTRMVSLAVLVMTAMLDPELSVPMLTNATRDLIIAVIIVTVLMILVPTTASAPVKVTELSMATLTTQYVKTLTNAPMLN
jgi:hypothetical protein